MGIRTKDLSKIGYTNNVARSLAINITGKFCKHETKEQILATLIEVQESPEKFRDSEIWSPLAEHFAPTLSDTLPFTVYNLRDEALPYKIYGNKFIDSLAKQQMDLAMRLPVAIAGALMPDAHAGYGLPIGGVLAVDNAVIPYAVGVDIGCRMSLSVFDAKADFLKRYSHQIKTVLNDYTHFGMEEGCLSFRSMKCWTGMSLLLRLYYGNYVKRQYGSWELPGEAIILSSLEKFS